MDSTFGDPTDGTGVDDNNCPLTGRLAGLLVGGGGVGGLVTAWEEDGSAD